VPRVVIHLPHASREIPDDLRPTFLLDDAALARELDRMTDHYTDELFAVPATVAATVRFPVSRLVVDPERFVEDEEEVMASRGMGVIYTRTAAGAPLRDPPSATERQELLERFYHPHHAALTGAVDAALARNGACLLVDCHSFPSRPLPYELDQRSDRPQVCLGTDEHHTPAWLVDLAKSLFGELNLDVAVDRPFSGALVPAKYLGRDSAVLAIMVELRRDLYMDEQSGAKRAEFSAVAAAVRHVLLGLIAASREAAAAAPAGGGES
jgi:N-formylglutamate amidohydrolase